jgi:hypothetical protein
VIMEEGAGEGETCVMREGRFGGRRGLTQNFPELVQFLMRAIISNVS